MIARIQKYRSGGYKPSCSNVSFQRFNRICVSNPQEKVCRYGHWMWEYSAFMPLCIYVTHEFRNNIESIVSSSSIWKIQRRAIPL